MQAGIREEHSAARQLGQGYIPNNKYFNGDPELIWEDFIKGKKGVNGMSKDTNLQLKKI